MNQNLGSSFQIIATVLSNNTKITVKVKGEGQMLTKSNHFQKAQ